MALTRYKSSQKSTRIAELPAAALRASLREGYGIADFKRDVLAGLVVGIVALPLAMALAIGVGVAPQYGLYTAIVSGFIVAALGGSRTQVTGPTAAFIVILAPIYTKFGLAGLYIAGLLGGVILIMMGLFRMGQMIHFIPHPVTTGFTAGIATVIATLQMKDLLGLTLEGDPAHFFDRLVAMSAALHTTSLREVAVGLGTLAVLLLFPRLTPRFPAPLVALPAAALLVFAIHLLAPGFEVATIASSFQTVTMGAVIQGIPPLPPLPILPWLADGPSGQPLTLTFDTFRALFSGALAIAMLGAIESLLSAVVADGLARTRHEPDAELIALGVGNVVTPFFGGIPATGAIARTATNVKAGARTPVAGMVHALTILAAVVVLAPLLGYLPMASLAALLLLVAWNMSEAKHFVHTIRVAPKSDVAVLLTCYGLTVAFDMVVGVAVGMVLAALLFMRRMAEVTRGRLTSLSESGAPIELPPGVVLYEISGPLFFGAAQKAMAALEIVAGQTKAVILLMNQVNAMDATGLVALEGALASLRSHRCLAIIAGAHGQASDLLAKAQVDASEYVTVCADLGCAIEVADRYAKGASQPPTSRIALG